MRIIDRDGMPTQGRSMKKFKCDVCGAEWRSDEYKEDWTQHSIPAYDVCPFCRTEIYAIGTFKNDETHSHIRK